MWKCHIQGKGLYSNRSAIKHSLLSEAFNLASLMRLHGESITPSVLAFSLNNSLILSSIRCYEMKEILHPGHDQARDCLPVWSTNHIRRQKLALIEIIMM